MNILALDSSDKVLSAALDANGVVWYTEIESGSSHSELILECADHLCRIAGFNQGGLNLVSCMKGPGSFTGLRIGFSTAKGLAMALGIPMLAIPTLDCLAYPFSMWPGIVAPVIDAKKGCFFSALYRHGRRLTDYWDISPELLAQELTKTKEFKEEPVLLTGGGAQLLYAKFGNFIPLEAIAVDHYYRSGRAKELLEIAKNDRFRQVNDTFSAPFYLRKSDAELNWN